MNKDFTHEDQQRIWDEEHKNPNVLLQMDSENASSGVKKFWDFFAGLNVNNPKGIEMGCGKGRNVIWLAQKGVEAHGFDFSPNAINEAKRRADVNKISNAHFKVQDATKEWDYESGYFDFGVDCFASTDIESEEGRIFAIGEMYRVIKPGGYLLVYLLSTEDEFHKKMINKNPSIDDKNAFHHDTGKFEKTFDQNEVDKQYKDFKVIKSERVEKTAEFFGTDYDCKHFWIVFQK